MTLHVQQRKQKLWFSKDVSLQEQNGQLSPSKCAKLVLCFLEISVFLKKTFKCLKFDISKLFPSNFRNFVPTLQSIKPSIMTWFVDSNPVKQFHFKIVFAKAVNQAITSWQSLLRLNWIHLTFIWAAECNENRYQFVIWVILREPLAL